MTGLAPPPVRRLITVLTLLTSNSGLGVNLLCLEFVKQRGKSGGTVKGTFEDLSDDERTKAFLQLLDYKLKLEKGQRLEKHELEKKENNFQELWMKLPSHQINPVQETEEEKKVRESIQVWYGINSSPGLTTNHWVYSIILSTICYFYCQIMK